MLDRTAHLSGSRIFFTGIVAPKPQAFRKIWIVSINLHDFKMNRDSKLADSISNFFRTRVENIILKKNPCVYKCVFVPSNTW